MTGTAVRVQHVETCPELGPICAERDEPAQLHDQQLYVSELRPVLEYSLNARFSVELQLPVKLTHTTISYRRLDGRAFEPDYVNIHHRNETLAGFGDPWLSARTRWELGPLSFSGQLGLTLPVGRTVEDPFALARAGQPHQHLQFGTGTFDPLFGLAVRVPIRRFNVDLYGQALLTVRENERRFRAGHRWVGGVSGEGPIVGGLRASLGVDVANEQPERWSGMIQQEGNLGRTDVLAGGSLAYPLGDFTLSLGAKVPVYQQLVTAAGHEQGQLTYPVILSLGLSRAFHVGH